MGRMAWAQVALGGVVFAIAGIAHAQEAPLMPYQEFHKRIRSAEIVAPLKSDLFGEQISLHDGSTEFSVTDISLPGNDGLPVQLTRRFKVESRKDVENLGGFGAWDIDVPYMYGTFDARGKWNTAGNGSTSRCSSLFFPDIRHPFDYSEVWSGVKVHFPGGGENEVLWIAGTDQVVPSDGKTYNWGSRDGTRFSCKASTSNGYFGEGFVAVDGNGTKYTFDVGIERGAGMMEEPTGGRFMRVNVYLMASRVEDRHGNWVAYGYSGDRLASITSSDGRSIQLTVINGKTTEAHANGKVWRYTYSSSMFGSALGAVTQPDGAAWSYTYSSNMWPIYPPHDVVNDHMCVEPPEPNSMPFTLTAKHPSGATGTFVFNHSRVHRFGVPGNCVIENIEGSIYSKLAIPDYYDVWAIVSKNLSGPGLSPLNWRYSSGVVTNPDGSSVRNVYGNIFGVNSGRLLSVTTVGPDGAVLKVETSNYVTDQEAAAMPFPDGFGLHSASDDPSLKVNRPLRTSTASQQGETFTSHVNTFDAHARPLSVTRSSSLGSSRIDLTSYHDDLNRWILGQTAKFTTGGVVGTEVSFDTLARPVTYKHFGKLVQTRTYHADGTVATVKDGKSNTTTLSSWYRGIPRTIKHPDNTTHTAVVDVNGWITQVTDANGFATSYTYDLMGRLTSISYPTGDSPAWSTTTQAFEPVAATEYGIPAGHWRQTVATGNARKIAYFDALWRPLVTREYDTANETATQRFTRQAFDHEGRVTFASYPSIVHNPVTGVRTAYDALSRPTLVTQDSELGMLTTRTEYLAGFKTRTTNPRGKQSVASYMAFDEPSTEWPVTIVHPEGATTDITRDLFGKPTALKRRNATGSVAVTRHYVYDAYQQLCKTLEPETGSALMDYDAAGNLVWSASGLALPSLTCDRTAVAAGSKVNRAYDTRNRLTALTFSDGNGSQTWSYTPDGLPSQVTTYNDEGLTTAVNAYTYNRRRLLTGESLSQPGLYTWSMGYGYNANGHLASHAYPNGLSIDYVPNALGQPTKVGSYAIGVSYFPNGALKQFTYGNGIVHTLTQNARGLPDRSRDAYGSAVVHDDGMDYDANGNVVAITDGARAGRGNRDMTYDALDRLTGTSSPMFSPATYTYDVLDNLKTVKVAGRDHIYSYDTSQRLTNVMNTVGGATVIGLGYDVRGNLANKNGVSYRFDMGNRLRAAVGTESYRYDAHGRRIEATSPAGSIFSLYGNDGVLRYQEDYRKYQATHYLHLNGSLVAEVVNAKAVQGAPTLTAPASSNSGGFTVSWTAVSGAASYRLEESANGGAWSEVTERTTLAWVASGRADGSYRYRVRSCAMGCSNYSSIVTVVVAVIPQGVPTVTVPAYVTTGSYTVSWTGVSLASTYQLQEQANGGSWVQIHDAAGGSKAISGKPTGTYAYRARACNASGCAGWSAVKTVSVEMPPAVAPSLTVPANGLNGTYTVTWGTVTGATSYTLEESVNGGAWAATYTGSAVSKAYTGKTAGSYAYRIKACNPAGCSPVSASQTVRVIYTPSSAPTLTVPSSNTSGSYTVSWTAVATAATYQLQERLAGGSWTLIHNAAGTSKALSGKATGTYEYQVRACNVAGCSAFAAIKSVQVTRAPTTAPALTVPATNTTGGYTVSWTAVAHAATYQLQERLSGGSWSDIHNAAGTSKAISGKATGTYEYQVRACNVAGCSAYAAVKSVQVTLPPISAPELTLPAGNTTGSYTVSWLWVSGATTYELDERPQGGSWIQIHNASATSKAISGKAYGIWEYRVRACNIAGCGGYMSGSVQVAPPPPPVPTGLTVTQVNSEMCRVAWNASSGATSYDVSNMGYIIDTTAGTTFNWDAQCANPYAVRACNAYSCSAWSANAYSY